MPTFTKAAIKATFISLLNKKPLNKITVKEIVSQLFKNSNNKHINKIRGLFCISYVKKPRIKSKLFS